MEYGYLFFCVNINAHTELVIVFKTNPSRLTNCLQVQGRILGVGGPGPPGSLKGRQKKKKRGGKEGKKKKEGKKGKGKKEDKKRKDG